MFLAAGAGIAQRGGKRVKKAAAADSEWVHPDAVGPRAQFLARSKKRHSESQIYPVVPIGHRHLRS